MSTSDDRDEAMRVPAAGGDPDSQQRLAKHLEAQGVDLPDGLSTEAPTDEQRTKYAEEYAKAEEKREAAVVRAQDAEDRRVAGESDVTTTPKGRTATPPSKATTADKSKS